MTTPDRFADLLLKSLVIDHDGDLIEIEEEEYRKLRDLVGALGEDWKSILMLLPDRSPWTYHGGLLYNPRLWFEADDPVTADRKNRLFACDCAELIIHHFEKIWNGDGLPRRAIEVSRRYAVGEATEEEREETHLAAFKALQPLLHSAAARVALSAAVMATASVASATTPVTATYPPVRNRYVKWEMLVDRLCEEK